MHGWLLSNWTIVLYFSLFKWLLYLWNTLYSELITLEDDIVFYEYNFDLVYLKNTLWMYQIFVFTLYLCFTVGALTVCTDGSLFTRRQVCSNWKCRWKGKETCYTTFILVKLKGKSRDFYQIRIQNIRGSNEKK